MRTQMGTDTVELLDQGQWDGMDQFYALNPLASKLAKASILSGGTGVDAASFTGGRALTHESLDAQLQSITLTEDDARFWRLLKKAPVHATIDQYNRLSDLGSEWGSAVGEADDPADQIGTIARMFEEVAYYRERRKVTDVAMLVNMTTDPYQEQVREGLLNIIHKLDRDLFWAVRSALPTKINGFFAKLIGETNAVNVDMAGYKITSRQTLVQAVAEVRNLGGRITHCLPNPLLVEDFALMYETAERLHINMGANGKVYGGGNFGGFSTSVGQVEFDADPFNRIGWKCPTVADGFDGKPAEPTTVTAAAAGTGGAIPSGDYQYKVTAMNADGESIGTALSGVVAVVLGEKVTLTITKAGGNTPTGFRIYRSKIDAVDASDCRYLWCVADSGAATTAYVDDGTWVPGTAHIPMLDLRPQATTQQWSQLLPASKKPLAPIGAYEWFLINLYGCYRMSKPTWNGLLRNVLPIYSLTQDNWDPLNRYP